VTKGPVYFHVEAGDRPVGGAIVVGQLVEWTDKARHAAAVAYVVDELLTVATKR
jgi:hypothetical protein